MPADYNSTARALALPVSPPDSPTLLHQQPRWSRRAPSNTLSHSQSPSVQQESGLGGRLLRRTDRLGRDFQKRFTPFQLALLTVAGLAAFTTAILFVIYQQRFFSWLEPRAVKWKNLKGGWCILWAMTFITAFPPVIGYSTCFTLAGFVYGLAEGWLIIATATVAGSTCSFITSRTIFSGFVQRLVANDKRFEAFSSVLKYDGLKLLIMIRLCPLPYSISNGAISTFPTVKPQTFALATAVASLKLLIPIFIGTRLAVIAKSGEKMDARTKAINWISILGGFLLGAVTGWLIYRKYRFPIRVQIRTWLTDSRTKARAREIESEEQAKLQRSGSRSGEFIDDSDGQAETATLLRDDQIDFRNDHDLQEYRDEFTDDDDDVFRYGDGDEERAMRTGKQSPQNR